MKSLFLAAGLAAAGCGPAGPTFGDIKGTVLFDGKPLPAGLVVFTNPADTLNGSGYLTEDGVFNIPHAPAGPVTLAVKTAEFKNLPDARTVKALQARGVPVVLGDPKIKGNKYVAIPERYADPKSSGLKFDIKANQVNELKIELTK